MYKANTTFLTKNAALMKEAFFFLQKLYSYSFITFFIQQKFTILQYPAIPEQTLSTQTSPTAPKPTNPSLQYPLK